MLNWPEQATKNWTETVIFFNDLGCPNNNWKKSIILNSQTCCGIPEKTDLGNVIF